MNKAEPLDCNKTRPHPGLPRGERLGAGPRRQAKSPNAVIPSAQSEASMLSPGSRASDLASPQPGVGSLPLFRSACCLAAVLFLAALPTLWAQGAEQDVHIAPRPKPTAPPPDVATHPELKTH